MANKRCSVCGGENNNLRRGYAYCKACHAAKEREYREERRVKIAALHLGIRAAADGMERMADGLSPKDKLEAIGYISVTREAAREMAELARANG